MARNIPRVPRFYIDELQYKKALGIFSPNSEDITESSWEDTLSESSDKFDIEGVNKLFDMNPTNYLNIKPLPAQTWSSPSFSMEVPMSIDNYTNKYFGVLGHNSLNAGLKIDLVDEHDTSILSLIENTKTINIFENGISSYNGFTLQKVTPEEASQVFVKINFDDSQVAFEAGIGCITMGSIWEMSLSPDLNLTLSYEFATKDIETVSGATLSNSIWYQKPLWVNQEAWGIDTDTAENYTSTDRSESLNSRRVGRRVYDLTFTFMQDDELLATNPMLNGLGMEGLTDTLVNFADAGTNSTVTIPHEDSATRDDLNINTDNSLFSQLIQKTLGFNLPFIFQPNKDVMNPSELMLAKVDARKGWSLEQIAPNLFRTKLRIKEVW